MTSSRPLSRAFALAALARWITPRELDAELDTRDVAALARDRDHVAADSLGKIGRVELVTCLVEPDDAEERPNLTEHVRRDALVRKVEHLVFTLRIRVVDQDLEEKTVELRLGQLEHVPMLVRVLRRDHEERIRKLVRLALDRHLPLLHRLEQRRLCARRRAVDLVREQHVREDRAGEEHLLAHPHGVDARQLGR